MKYKIGQKLYCIDFDTDSGKCSTSVYIVRTIRGGFIYAIFKLKDVTWGKKSKKNGDFGWLDPIESIWREKTILGNKFNSIHTTKKQAWRACAKRINNWNLHIDLTIKEKIIKTCKRMIKRKG